MEGYEGHYGHVGASQAVGCQDMIQVHEILAW